MYYMLRQAAEVQFGIVRDPAIASTVSFQTGSLIQQTLREPLVFGVGATAAHPPADFLYDQIPVFSDRLVSAFQALGVDNLQLFRAKLRNSKTKEEWPTYAAVNIIGLVSCLAVAESNAEESLPPLYSFDLGDLVIEEERASGVPLFRLAESPSVVLVEDRVGDGLMDLIPDLVGVDLRDVASV